MGMGKGVWMMTLQTSSTNQIKETRVNSRICSTTSNNKGDGIMCENNETNLILKYNNELKNIIFNDDLLPKEGKLLKEAKRYYMNLSEGDDSCEGKQVLLTEKDEHVCSPDYLEYYWVEFMHNGKECVVSLFHRDFDGQSGNIHVMPGVLQVWEKAYDKDKKNPFEKDKGTITFPQSIRSSAGETVYLWNPLIDYDKFSPKQFIWTQYVDINSLKTIIEDVLIKSKFDKTLFNMKFDELKDFKKFLGDQAKKEVFNLFKRDAIRFKEIGGTSNYPKAISAPY